MPVIKRPNFYAIAAAEFIADDGSEVEINCQEDLEREYEAGNLSFWQPFENDDLESISGMISDQEALFHCLYKQGKRDAVLEADGRLEIVAHGKVLHGSYVYFDDPTTLYKYKDPDWIDRSGLCVVIGIDGDGRDLELDNGVSCRVYDVVMLKPV